MKKTKIICSIGPASCNVDVMTKMVESGMNVARINFSHATMEERENVVKTVKEVREITGKTVAILYDTKGPEFRSGILENETITLVPGNKIRIVKENVVGNEERITVNHPNALDGLSVGSTILLENGLMEIEVEDTDAEGVTCRIINGGVLGNRKSLSVPGIKLDIPFISEVDKEDILYAGNNDGDFLALSFVSCKEDVLEAKKLLKEKGLSINIISKIESQTGIDNLDEIISVSEGIMVARGDLGVEIPMYDLPFAQKLMIQKCREQGKIAIVATEMLESMKKNPRPTRAEITDVTSAVLDGTDAVMLSGETTTGNYPIDTVLHMANICINAEDNNDYIWQEDLHENIVRSAICASAVNTANMLDAKLIVTASLKGTSSKMVSNFKPNCPILATVTSEKVANSLALNYGVYSCIVNEYQSTDEIVEDAIKNARNIVELNKKDIVIITGGFPNNAPEKSTNFMKIEII